MTKNQIEKFAVGYPSYPTDCVEAVLKVSNFDTEIAEEILDDKEKTLAIWQNGTIMNPRSSTSESLMTMRKIKNFTMM